MKLFNIQIHKNKKKVTTQPHTVGLKLDSGLKAGKCDLWSCDFLDDAFDGTKAELQNVYSTLNSFFS